MKCKSCQVDKLSREFPIDIISKNCQHIPTFCIKCLINHLYDYNSKQCPECKSILDQKEFETIKISWEKASFKIDIDKILTSNNNNNNTNNNKINQNHIAGNFFVVMLDGHKIQLKLENIKSVLDLKQAISSKTNIEISKQKLIFNEVELEVMIYITVMSFVIIIYIYIYTYIF
jgi:hypothetical protein